MRISMSQLTLVQVINHLEQRICRSGKIRCVRSLCQSVTEYPSTWETWVGANQSSAYIIFMMKIIQYHYVRCDRKSSLNQLRTIIFIRQNNIFIWISIVFRCRGGKTHTDRVSGEWSCVEVSIRTAEFLCFLPLFNNFYIMKYTYHTPKNMLECLGAETWNQTICEHFLSESEREHFLCESEREHQVPLYSATDTDAIASTFLS